MTFTDPYAYTKFKRLIVEKDRFAQSKDARAFIEEFARQVTSRFIGINKGEILFRAANDYVEIHDKEKGEFIFAACRDDRMIPSSRFAGDGRINPKGVPVLYLATSIETAISEIRPWVGDIVSVVAASINQECELANLFDRQNEHQDRSIRRIEAASGGRPLSNSEINETVWADIDYAFSKPVSRNENGIEYAPTQLLASVIREKGFDGVAYKSLFGGAGGYNVALFDVKKVDLLKGQLHRVKSVKYNHEEDGVPWVKSPAK